jgi:hypothetical protein
VTSVTFTQSQAAEFLGYSTSAFRRLVRDGKLPGPIDPSMRPKLRRWSRPMLERYVGSVDRLPVWPTTTTGSSSAYLATDIAVDRDATPAHGIVRPLRVVGGAS